MKVIQLKTNPALYSSNSYLLLGNWNSLSDINAVIDTGSDNYILNEIDKINTGVGKNPLDIIVLTHNHFDHTGGVVDALHKYKPIVYSKAGVNGAPSRRLKGGERLKLADRHFDVISSPGHSSDSICLYCEKDEVLFSGDTTLSIKQPGGTYTKYFLETMKVLAGLRIKVIYPGHGPVINYHAKEMIDFSLHNIIRSEIINQTFCEVA